MLSVICDTLENMANAVAGERVLRENVRGTDEEALDRESGFAGRSVESERVTSSGSIDFVFSDFLPRMGSSRKLSASGGSGRDRRTSRLSRRVRGLLEDLEDLVSDSSS